MRAIGYYRGIPSHVVNTTEIIHCSAASIIFVIIIHPPFATTAALKQILYLARFILLHLITIRN